MSTDVRRWTSDDPEGPRLDVNGVAWFACDPYPTWYRRESDRLIVDVPRFPKGNPEMDDLIETLAGDLFVGSHRAPFPDNEEGMEQAREWARSIVKTVREADAERRS